MDAMHSESYLSGRERSVAMTSVLDAALRAHFDHPGRQEDLTFAYWAPSLGARRFSAVLHTLALPSEDDDRILDGNVAFGVDYLQRVLDAVPEGSGVALLHSHLGPGWQEMSLDDEVAERDRLASAVAGRTGLPLLGLTWGTDRTWSGRFWGRVAPFRYRRLDVRNIRVVGPERLATSYHPVLAPAPNSEPSQVATVSVWGDRAQADIARARVGVIGLGSVGSVVVEALMRSGVSDIVLIDHDWIEDRNLDRTVHAERRHALQRTAKVEVAREAAQRTHTAAHLDLTAVPRSLTSPEGVASALDCDVIVCCVDRPWPRWVLNAIAYSHLVPVIDGGIYARVNADGRPLHIDWRIHTVGPGRACLLCLDALRRSDVSLDRDGLLDDPDYLQGLSESDRDRYNRRNVFAFSVAVAAHEVLQLAGLVAGSARVGGIGPQHYAAFPGQMTVTPTHACQAGCEIDALTASAVQPL